MTKIAVLGDGILGKELSKSNNYKCFSRRNNTLDISDINLLDNIVKKNDIIINCLANTDSYSDDFKSHWEVNYFFVKKLVESINRFDKKLVHISTEFVYAMNEGSPCEEDEPIPQMTYYAVSKLLADKYIINKSKNFLIFRSLHKAKDLNYDEVWDIMTTGDKVDIIAEIMVRLIKNNANGVYNIGTKYKHLSEIINGKKIIKPPKEVPVSINMNLEKLEGFLKNSC